MMHFGRIVGTIALAAGLLTGILVASPQKIVKQRPLKTAKISRQDLKQKLVQQRQVIKQDRQKLQTDRQQFGKGNAQLKSDRQQLRKDVKVLQRLQKVRGKAVKVQKIRKKLS